VKISYRQITNKIIQKYQSNIFYVHRYPNGFLYGRDESTNTWREISGEVEKMLRETYECDAHHIREVIADLCQLLYRPELPPEPPWYLINFKNGVYDLKENRIRDPHPEEFFLTQIPHRLDLEVKGTPDIIDRLFSDWVSPDFKELLYEMVGYFLLRSNGAKKFFNFNGEGNNGKSTCAELIRRILGCANCSALSLDDIIFDRFSLVFLQGKLLNITGELIANIRRADRLKLLTGGDSVFVQEKFKQGFFIQPYTRFLFMGNLVPATCDTSEAFYDRTLVVPFPNNLKDKKDPRVLDKITPEELQRLLKKLTIEVIPRLIERNFRFCIDLSVEESREKWEDLSNPIRGFKRQFFKDAPGNYEFVPSAVLFQLWEQYRRQNKIRQISQRELGEFLRREGFINEIRRLSEEEQKRYRQLPIICRGWSIPDVTLVADVTCSLIFNNANSINIKNGVTGVTNVTNDGGAPKNDTVGIKRGAAREKEVPNHETGLLWIKKIIEDGGVSYLHSTQAQEGIENREQPGGGKDQPVQDEEEIPLHQPMRPVRQVRRYGIPIFSIRRK